MTTTRVFTQEEWLKALEGMQEAYEIFVPFKEGDFHLFRPLKDGKTPDFKFQNARLSPKQIVYPQSERMFEFSVDQRDSDAGAPQEAPKDFSSQAVVGIRPCDAHGFHVVRVNFDNPDYRDPWWVQRFENTTLIGLGCSEPCTSCFCTSVGGGPFHEECLDGLAYDLDGKYLVKAISEKGEAFLDKMQGGEEASKEDLEKAEGLASSASEKISSQVHTDKLKEKNVTELFDAPFWEDVAFACINCGTCTYLCPTCWCFDIQDEVCGTQGDRIRNWDSCMFPLFTYHGSGHNPRDQKHKRLRQRFMHKLKYYVDKYEDGVQCSGCGRCVRFCPVNIDIREVCELMNNF